MKKQRLTAADWEARVREWERSGLSGVEWLAFGIAVLEVGAGSMQRVSGTPVEMVLILEGLILIFLLMSDHVTTRLRARSAKAKVAS